MRCRDVEALWDELRGECQASLKETVHTHLRACPSCQAMYEQYEGVAYCLSCLPQPQPSCDLAKKVIQHVAALKGKYQPPIVLTAVTTPIGRLYVGLKHDRIAYLSLDAGEPSEAVVARAERRLRRHVVLGEAPLWLVRELDRFFSTWTVDDSVVDISDLTPFEQARTPRRGADTSRRDALVRVGRDTDRAAESRARGRTGDGAQSVAAAVPLPSGSRLVGRPAQLFLRPRNESPAS